MACAVWPSQCNQCETGFVCGTSCATETIFLRQIGAIAASQNVANVNAVKKTYLYGLTWHNTFIHLTTIGWHANDTSACQPESESVKFCRLRLQLRLRPKLPTPTDSDSDSDSDSAALPTIITECYKNV